TPAKEEMKMEEVKTYTIKSGDTLGKIAKANKTTINAILKENKNLKDANSIYVGEELKIPAN
ncbi:MAG: LysM peptidoglycan-binding domain-containing protein, partial [Psychrilyobacter sp.]|nr:LysM peptidoglycan-binding domain-containing protein [Psychrilyobacter sp.]